MKEVNEGKNYQTIFIVILSCMSLGLWAALLLYVIYFKYSGDLFHSYPMDKLGQTGDIFNIATSFSSVITVMLVAYAVVLQKKELSAVKDQIENQSTRIEEDERTNRTIRFIDEWNREKSDREKAFSFLERVILLEENGYSKKIDIKFIVKVLENDKIITLISKTISKCKSENENLEQKINKLNEDIELTRYTTPIMDSLNKGNELRKEQGELSAIFSDRKNYLRKIENFQKFLVKYRNN